MNSKEIDKRMIDKRSLNSFLFSVNESTKYPIIRGDRVAIRCHEGWCAMFGDAELVIFTDSNNRTRSWCIANGDSFKLPTAQGSEYPSLNGGEKIFQLKNFEVY